MLTQYHQGQVTVPRLVAQLQAIGVTISKRQVVRLLIAGQGEFLAEARDVLRAGLETAMAPLSEKTVHVLAGSLDHSDTPKPHHSELSRRMTVSVYASETPTRDTISVSLGWEFAT